MVDSPLVLVAGKPVLYRGTRYQRGERLDPPPVGYLRHLLVSQRYALEMPADEVRSAPVAHMPVVSPPVTAAPTEELGTGADRVACDCGRTFASDHARRIHQARAHPLTD